MIEPAKKISEWDYQYENEITCPYCLHKDQDSWDYHMEDGDVIEIECGKCEKPFEVSMSVSISYTSYPKSDNPPQGEEK
jgi:transcription elongation factor Elf1